MKCYEGFFKSKSSFLFVHPSAEVDYWAIRACAYTKAMAEKICVSCNQQCEGVRSKMIQDSHFARPSNYVIESIFSVNDLSVGMLAVLWYIWIEWNPKFARKYLDKTSWVAKSWYGPQQYTDGVFHHPCSDSLAAIILINWSPLWLARDWCVWESCARSFSRQKPYSELCRPCLRSQNMSLCTREKRRRSRQGTGQEEFTPCSSGQLRTGCMNDRSYIGVRTTRCVCTLFSLTREVCPKEVTTSVHH